MYFSSKYAILFGLAGFVAATYNLKVGEKAKAIPVIGLALCVLYSLSSYSFAYGFLTGIEYAVGFGLAHAVYGKKKSDGNE